MGGLEISVVKKAKYLGVLLDTKRSFRSHIKSVTGSTKGLVNALGRLMSNMGGPGVANVSSYEQTPPFFISVGYDRHEDGL